jgi:hypothetical protein
MSAQATQLYRLMVAAGHAEIDGCGIYKLFESQAAAPWRPQRRPLEDAREH